jgi:hypothetical protein
MLVIILSVHALWGTAVFGQKVKSMLNLKDDEVIAALSSHDAKEAHQAVEEIMRRGERMIPLLTTCKGNTSFFYGYGLGHHSSSFLIPLPRRSDEVNEGNFITVEVAALYLISAIYHQTLEFADAPYLTDGSPVEWQRFNTPERVKKAWASAETWMQAYKHEGMESLRSKHQSPLSVSKVHFWAGH